MITVHLSGGLGNQLFQYAAGFALAKAKGTSLEIETRSFRRAKRVSAQRDVQLSAFSLPIGDFCSPQVENRLNMRWKIARALRLPPRFLGIHADELRFDPRFFDLDANTYLRGYFQSERYFASVASDIRQAFRPSDPAVLGRVDAQLQSLRKEGRPLVSLHVRRGDYLNLSNRDCLTSDAFFDAAIALIPDGYFLVFSDDLEWCRNRFDDATRFAFSPFTHDLDDFFAMSMCDHHVIAKSTFSWWAAWLNQKPGRRVIAPSIIQDFSWAAASPDYYPDSWTVL